MEHEIRRLPPSETLEELGRLRSEGYNVLVDLTVVDLSALPEPRPASERFDVVYRLMALDAATGLETKPRVELRCAVGEAPVLRSARALWPIADWLEREVWDMFGVGFTDRPVIKRLLMYEEFSGHPLRKDYPIAKRQPLIGPPSGEREGSPSFNIIKPTVTFE